MRASSSLSLAERMPARTRGQEFFEVEGLGDEIVDPRFICVEQAAFVGVGRQHDEMHGIGIFSGADAAAEFDAVDIGHDPVGDDDARAVLGDDAQRLFAVGGTENVFAGGGEEFDDFDADERIVLDDQNLARIGADLGGSGRGGNGDFLARRGGGVIAQAPVGGDDLVFGEERKPR